MTQPAAAHDSGELPQVSVVMPVRNEAPYLERSLSAVLAQDYPADRLEVIVVDGCSDDGTGEVARAVISRFGAADRVHWIENRDRTTPTSLNLALSRARGGVIVRVDGHAEIQPGYLRLCVAALARPGVGCAGGQCITVAETPTARAIAAAQSSRFGVGNVAFRVGRADPGPADTVPFGAWRREVFDEIGGFDPELIRNQDDELALRIIQSGRTVWYDPAIVSKYYSRTDIRSLWRQYWQYGIYKVRVMQKRRAVASVRHLVPAATVVGLAAGTAAGAVTRSRRIVAATWAPYLAANIAASVATGAQRRLNPARLALSFATLHAAYGSGTLVGVWRWRRFFQGQ